MRETDTVLIAQTLQGNQTAFGKLVSYYQDAVYAIAYSFSKNFHDAEDIAQDVFLRAYQGLCNLQDHPKFKSWLYGLTRNVAHELLRKRRVNISLDTIPPVAEPVQSDMRKTDNTAVVWNALSRLSLKQRTTLTMAYINGYSYKQLANFLTVPIGTIKSRINEAKEKLKKEIFMKTDQSIKKTISSKRPGKEFTRKTLVQISSLEDLKQAVDPFTIKVAMCIYRDVSIEEISKKLNRPVNEVENKIDWMVKMGYVRRVGNQLKLGITNGELSKKLEKSLPKLPASERAELVRNFSSNLTVSLKEVCNELAELEGSHGGIIAPLVNSNGKKVCLASMSSMLSGLYFTYKEAENFKGKLFQLYRRIKKQSGNGKEQRDKFQYHFYIALFPDKEDVLKKIIKPV